MRFLETCAEGRLFPSVAELFSSERFIAIVKPPNSGQPPGIVPIAIGTVFRRTVSTMVLRHAAKEANDFLLPEQVSLALVAGTKVLVHGFRDVKRIPGHDQGKVAVFFGARNAFNSIIRAAFLEIVIIHALTAAPLVHALYETQP